MAQKLSKYKSKRNFKKTPEPSGKRSSTLSSSKGRAGLRGKPRAGSKPIFVIQQHHASHMHYDLRLEVDGVLKSWAVPKGPSTNPRIKRLAAETDDHPLAYAKFEGIIPEGYGAGTVIVWDKGTYKNLTEKNDKPISMKEGIKKGHIIFFLRGKKLKGAYALTRFRDNNWLLVKMKDEYANARTNPVNTQPQSVLSKKTIKLLDQKFKR